LTNPGLTVSAVLSLSLSSFSTVPIVLTVPTTAWLSSSAWYGLKQVEGEPGDGKGCNGTENHSGSMEAYLEACQDIQRDIITYIWKDGGIIGKTEIYLDGRRLIWIDGDMVG
jgi:hypothetical protein